jgi:hypothetical protein
MLVKELSKTIKIIILNCGCKIERVKGKKDKFVYLCFKHKD